MLSYAAKMQCAATELENMDISETTKTWGCIMWTPEETKLVVQFANEGYSSTQIAAALRTKTRNAVIGKLNRIGVKLKNPQFGSDTVSQKPTTPQEPQASAVMNRVIQKRDYYPPKQGIPENLTNLVDLQPHQCRWPFGDKNFKFCGMPKHPGSPYCLNHKLLSQVRHETAI